MKDYPINNLLREPTEAWSAITCFSLAFLAYCQPHLFLLTESISFYAAITLLIPGSYRAWQAIKVKRYHHRLLAMPTYALSTSEIPLSKNWLFLGKGFRWRPSHTQKLHQIKQVKTKSLCSEAIAIKR